MSAEVEFFGCGESLAATGCLALTGQARSWQLPCGPCRNRAKIGEQETRITELEQKVADAETLLFRTYDRDVMTRDGTRDAWEGFHGAAEFIRETQATREASDS